MSSLVQIARGSQTSQSKYDVQGGQISSLSIITIGPFVVIQSPNLDMTEASSQSHYPSYSLRLHVLKLLLGYPTVECRHP